jgi:hypothetical protein
LQTFINHKQTVPDTEQHLSQSETKEKSEHILTNISQEKDARYNLSQNTDGCPQEKSNRQSQKHRYVASHSYAAELLARKR